MTDFDGIEIHTKLEVNKPQSFLAGQEEADTELTGPKVRQFIAQHNYNRVAPGVWWINHLPCIPGVADSIPSFRTLSDETLSCGPVFIRP